MIEGFRLLGFRADGSLWRGMFGDLWFLHGFGSSSETFGVPGFVFCVV